MWTIDWELGRYKTRGKPKEERKNDVEYVDYKKKLRKVGTCEQVL